MVNITLEAQDMAMIILSRVWVTKDGIGFIGYLQAVTTNNYYNTVSDFHTIKHSTLISSVYLH
jgi:hypothetical protein